MRLLVGLLLVCTLTACAAQGAGPEAPAPAGEEPTTEPEPDLAVACTPIEQPPAQSGSHLIGDQDPPVPYNSVPPTSGWHASGAFAIDVHPPEEPLSEARQVSVLEAGGVVVTYRDIGDGARTRLEAHVREHHDSRVAVTSYAALDPGQVAFTAWGTLQRCDGLDLAALDAFTAAYADKEPATPGSH